MSTPYYEDDQVTLYHGDCREITEWLEADVLVTDPPYGMNFQSRMRKGPKLARIAGDEDTTVRDAVAALWGPDRPARRGRPVAAVRRMDDGPPHWARHRHAWALTVTGTQGPGERRHPPAGSTSSQSSSRNGT